MNILAANVALSCNKNIIITLEIFTPFDELATSNYSRALLRK